MRISSWILSLTTLSIVALPACDPEPLGPTADDAAEDDRGHVGKADLIGTCEDACGGQSNDGNCWCDDQCAAFGDCCSDQQAICGEAASCDGENPSGCIETGCGEGQMCSTETDACIASACSCDEATGTWQCTADCSGGECVPEPTPAVCEGDNPAGCAANECGEGEVCSTETDGCFASACSCDESTNSWLCTADCSGGECVPEPTPTVCEGDNPAGCVTNGCGEGEVCSTETEACISSACSCDESTMSWLCTADCSGGECVPVEPDDACPGTNPAENCIDGSCIPSGCSCDEANGTWLCTPDCSGGVEC